MDVSVQGSAAGATAPDCDQAACVAAELYR
jgi:hypothetical protein